MKFKEGPKPLKSMFEVMLARTTHLARVEFNKIAKPLEQRRPALIERFLEFTLVLKGCPKNCELSRL